MKEEAKLLEIIYKLLKDERLCEKTRKRMRWGSGVGSDDFPSGDGGDETGAKWWQVSERASPAKTCEDAAALIKEGES